MCIFSWSTFFSLDLSPLSSPPLPTLLPGHFEMTHFVFSNPPWHEPLCLTQAQSTEPIDTDQDLRH